MGTGETAYDALVNGKGGNGAGAQQIIEKSYAEDVTDEFIKPSVVLDSSGKALAIISDGDMVICFNFRTDRCREITEVLTQTDIPGFRE